MAMSAGWSIVMVQTEISQQWLDGFWSEIHGPQRMNPADFGDPFTFPLAPSSGQNFTLPNTLFYKQKVMTFPSALEQMFSSKSHCTASRSGCRLLVLHAVSCGLNTTLVLEEQYRLRWIKHFLFDVTDSCETNRKGRSKNTLRQLMDGKKRKRGGEGVKEINGKTDNNKDLVSV